MRLPHANSAQLDVRKLRDYCLNLDNPRGMHKARVLYSALGVVADDAEWLRVAILEALPAASVTLGGTDRFGQRYAADVVVTRHRRSVVLRTAWIIPPDADAPRFVSCWVL